MSFSDLLCTEDLNFPDSNGSTFLQPKPELPTVENDEEDDESIAVLIELEGEFPPLIGFPASLKCRPLEFCVRQEAVLWIIEANSCFGFRPLTAYLAVNYMDRFLSVHALPSTGWADRILSVACLSLAAKMEESAVPSLPDLQVGQGRYVFRSESITRMELLILSKLDWKLRPVTPFAYIESFARKIDPSRRHYRSIVSRGIQLILDIIREADFEDFRPSSIAAAAVLCSVHEIPDIGQVDPGSAASWCPGMDMENISNCCRLMTHNLVEKDPTEASRNPPSATVPQSPIAVLEHQDGSSAVSTSPSGSPSSKRRRSLQMSRQTTVQDEKYTCQTLQQVLDLSQSSRWEGYRYLSALSAMIGHVVDCLHSDGVKPYTKEGAEQRQKKVRPQAFINRAEIIEASPSRLPRSPPMEPRSSSIETSRLPRSSPTEAPHTEIETERGASKTDVKHNECNGNKSHEQVIS